MDKSTTIDNLKEIIKEFCEERDWDQYHSAKDLSVALVIEVGELLEHFRWKNKKEIKELFKNKKKREKISDEMADVFYFLLRLAQRYDIDLSESLKRKMDKNKEKYPIEKAEGSNKKYTEF